MAEQLRDFAHAFLHALRNLLPIILVVVAFQALLFREWPDGGLSIAIGLLIVAIGVALFLQGLELSIFPVGKRLANQFARRGSMPLLMAFGFAIGFSAVVAEPALIAVAEQAYEISEGRIDALTLRLIVATSVGLVMALGVFRVILGHPIHWYMIVGYILVVAVTFFAPEEIVGLAYDSGTVTTNVVTVPLIAALGIGLASSIRGRNPLIDGFGLVAMVVVAPMISVQLYGILAYADPGDIANGAALVAAGSDTEPPSGPLVMVLDLFGMLRDVLPIILVILFFQYTVLRRPLASPVKVSVGFALVIIGLYAFVVGLKLGLFPIGQRMAEQLITFDTWLWVYLFAFTIGFATTMAEPALIAVGQQAEEAAAGKIQGNAIRLLVAVGVAIGITIGVHRIIGGHSLPLYVALGYGAVVMLTCLAPRYIRALAYDLGGVSASAVTVPLVTALGIGLASQIEGRSVLIDGFGLLVFTSIFPIVTVMSYAILMDRVAHWREKRP
ncbi:DUF1538 domain-containing protein [uncultured Halomonas sp.]|uniref:DUF1538 domain-containing protein n=1 Tax=uncultured Halomonas sp. TaxID=173971 RepID=UPI00263723FF|nr:DUF1538 domain-containing protein [uncultured Halomonas sp.]